MDNLWRQNLKWHHLCFVIIWLSCWGTTSLTRRTSGRNNGQNTLAYTSGCWGARRRFWSAPLRAGWGTHTSAAALTVGAGTAEETQTKQSDNRGTDWYYTILSSENRKCFFCWSGLFGKKQKKKWWNYSELALEDRLKLKKKKLLHIVSELFQEIFTKRPFAVVWMCGKREYVYKRELLDD